MQASLHAPLVFVTLLWVTYLGQLYHTYQMGKLKTHFVRLIWLAGFFGVLVITFSGKQMEQMLDGFVGGLPLSFYTKFVCALLIIHILYLMLRQTMRVSRLKNQLFLHLCLGTIVVGLLTIPAFVQLPMMPREQLRYGLLALRDIVVCTYMIVIFIPASYGLWKNETIRPTRLKHFASVLFDLSYLLLGLGNILTFMASLSKLETAAFIDAAFRPVMALCALFFTIALTSNYVLGKLLLIQQQFLLWRLRCLEMRIVHRVGQRASDPSGLGLEDRIYRTVISILDCCPKLQYYDDLTLYERIEQVIRTQHEYPDLIEDLAKLA